MVVYRCEYCNRWGGKEAYICCEKIEELIRIENECPHDWERVAWSNSYEILRHDYKCEFCDGECKHVSHVNGTVLKFSNFMSKYECAYCDAIKEIFE